LTSSAAPKDGDSSRGLTATLLVRGSTARHPESLPAQPRHALPQSKTQHDQVVGLALADIFDSTSIEGGKRRFLPGLKAEASTPRSQ
jgi:hypothetical protein